MSSLTHVAAAVQHVVTTVADETAPACGFVQRRRTLTGALFVQTLVLGWLAEPTASLRGLTQTAAKLGIRLSPQALAQRFTPAAAQLLETVLAAAIRQVVVADPVAIPLLQRFTGVFLLDSTTIRLPDALAAVWAGCGGRVARHTQAALKVTVWLDLLAGGLAGPLLSAGRTQDRATALQHAAVPVGAVRLSDLGFWSLAVFRTIAAAGAFWLSRLNQQVVVFAAEGTRLALPTWLAAQAATIDVPVTLGVREGLPARLLGVRVPQAIADARRRTLRAAAKREGRTPSAHQLALAAWTLLVTNVPAERLSVAEALVLARARWQIELLFKLWKDQGHLDVWRSADPQRILCEVYAKLTAMVLQHWLLLTGCWGYADRSLSAAAAIVRREATCLIGAIHSRRRLVTVLADLRRCLAAGGPIAKRRRKPSTFQLLLDPTLGGLT